MELTNNARIAVIGGGPAGTFFTYFLLDLAHRLDLEFQVDIYEQKQFSGLGAKGCNHCGGLISESLIQALATDGINIPSNIFLSTIDRYVLHSGEGDFAIKSVVDEMRIATVYRGGGPKKMGTDGSSLHLLQSFDGFLLSLAVAKGARHIQEQVIDIAYQEGFPQVATKSGRTERYDLLVGAIGVNASGPALFQKAGFGYKPPRTVRAYIMELYLGKDLVKQYTGNAMHILMLDLPGVKQAAVIPKNNFMTICLVGEKIAKEEIEKFMEHPKVKKFIPNDFKHSEISCHCFPKLAIGVPRHPFNDRIVLVGDCCISRLYKDGIGSAYRMARACASVVVFRGISKQDFKKYYWPICMETAEDNRIGHFIFWLADFFKKSRFIQHVVFYLFREKSVLKPYRHAMSERIWNVFTGSSSYKDILFRFVLPLSILRLTSVFIKEPSDITDEEINHSL
ncbi:MAG: hypothetical protein WCP34_09650 [Pseudomonadota bacterium]